MAFDPNAATAAYIDSLGPTALQKAHDYTVGREWMLLWGLIVTALVTWLIIKSGILDRVDAKLGEKRKSLRAFVVSAWVRSSCGQSLRLEEAERCRSSANATDSLAHSWGPALSDDKRPHGAGVRA